MIRPFAALCLLSALGGTGCFVTDSINQRPSIDIRQTSSAELFRGSDVTLVAEADDPEGHIVFFQWRAYLCTDATQEPSGARPGCDAVPFQTEVLDTLSFQVPSMRADAAVPVQVVFVILEAQDDYGAIARPQQELLIPVANHLPDLKLSTSAAAGAVIGTPVEVYAELSDADDDVGNITVARTLYRPTNDVDPGITDLTIAPPEQVGWRFTPNTVGMWELKVTATDPVGGMFEKSAIVQVVPDRAPCLAQYSPIAAPSGSTWPMTDPTLFQVSIVDDDLDSYPGPGTKFTWSLLPPGASTRQALGVTGNGVSLDPSNYAPGDILELRVEIYDRNNTSLSGCGDAATCSVVASDTCLQRLTWRVEVH